MNTSYTNTIFITKRAFLLLAFFIGAATVALAQTVSFDGAPNVILAEPTPNGGDNFIDYSITINISSAPGADVVVDITADVAGLTSQAEQTFDYDLLPLTPPTRVTFPMGSTMSQTIMVRIYDEYIGDEDIAEAFRLTLTLFSGSATMGAPLEVTITDNAGLPIDLVYFHGRTLRNTVELFWQTAAEKNNAYMAVERSGDGFHFVEIGKVKPANGPNSNVSQVYKLVDTQPLASINYYRLRQVDLDEKHTYHPIIAVDYNGKTPSKITLQTNLTETDQIQVFFNELLNEQATLVVVDLNGRIVQKTTISADTAVYSINTAQLVKGYYTVQVQTRTTRNAIQFVKM